MIRHHHHIKTALAFSAIGATVLLAGCGGSSTPSKAAPANTIRAAYVSSSVSGYQIAIKVTGSAAGHPVKVTGTGAFDETPRAGRLTLNVTPTPGAHTVQFDAVFVAHKFYLKLPASLAANVPGGKPWLALNIAELGKKIEIARLSSLAEHSGANPAQFLGHLRAASTGTVENLGQQTIDGTRATGERVIVDLSKVANTLPAAQRRAVASAINSIEKLTGLRYLPTQTWVDSAGHLRRIVLTETGSVAGQPFAEHVQLDFVKYGPQPVPTAPPADQTINLNSLIGTH